MSEDPASPFATAATDNARIEALLNGPSDGHDWPLHRFVALPRATSPRLILPANSRRAAAHMIRGSSPGDRATSRVKRSALAAFASLGLLRLVPGPRLEVRGPERARLLAELRRRLGWVADLGVHLGTLRPNRKPVLLLADGSGRVRAFAKVGWDESTAQLVGNEARALNTMVRRVPLEVPVLLEDFVYDDNRIVVQSAVRVGRTGRDAIDSGGLASVVHAIAGPRSPSLLADTAYAGTLLERCRSSGLQTTRGVQAIADLLMRNGSATLATGAWHGDLTPWNSSLLGDTISVWDWERWDPDVPLGLDVLHYHLRLRHAAVEPRLALAHARAVSRPTLERLGVPREAHIAVQECHIAELIIRFGGDPAMKGLVESLLSALQGREEES